MCSCIFELNKPSPYLFYIFFSFEESGEPNNDELAFYSFSSCSSIVLSTTASDAQAMCQEIVSFLNKLMHELALPGDSKYRENWR